MVFIFNHQAQQWELKDTKNRVVLIIGSDDRDDIRFWQQWAANHRASHRYFRAEVAS